MQNPLVEEIEREFKRLAVNTAKLNYESYNQQNFGNAEAVYKLDNLKLRFIRDRGDLLISLGGTHDVQLFYIDDVAVWMGWITLDALLQFYNAPIDFSKPPRGPLFNLFDALDLIVKDFKQLNHSFSFDQLVSTHAQLKNVERLRNTSKM